MDILSNEIERLCTACLKLRYHLKEFRTAVTVVLRKPKKLNYSDPAAYRSIALLKTLNKILESIVAKRFSKLAEKHRILSEI